MRRSIHPSGPPWRPRSIYDRIGISSGECRFIRQNARNRALVSRNEHTRRSYCGLKVVPMRVNPTIALACILASLTGLLGYACFGAGESLAASEARQPIAVMFSLDRPIDAGSATLLLAAYRSFVHI